MTVLSPPKPIPGMLDYDREAAHHDVTRGGDARASAAAEAIESLLPPAADRIADLGCGTDIVTVRMCRPSMCQSLRGFLHG